MGRHSSDVARSGRNRVSHLSDAFDEKAEVDVILKDSQVITSIAADKATKVEGIIDGVGDTVESVVSAIKGNQNVVTAATSVVNAASSLSGLIKKAEVKQRRKRSEKDNL